MEAYEFIDAEAALIQYLRPWKASTQVPSTKPAEHILVARVGGTADRFMDRPMVTFIVSALSWPAAADLARRVRQKLMSASELGGLPVYRWVEIGGPARSPDPDTGDPRYQFTLEFRVRGRNLTPA